MEFNKLEREKIRFNLNIDDAVRRFKDRINLTKEHFYDQTMTSSIRWREGFIMNGYKVKVYISNAPKDDANGQVFNLSIIPRTGDYIDVTYTPDPKNHPRRKKVGVFKVERVTVHEIGSTFDAVLHLENDEEANIVS